MNSPTGFLQPETCSLKPAAYSRFNKLPPQDLAGIDVVRFIGRVQEDGQEVAWITVACKVIAVELILANLI